MPARVIDGKATAARMRSELGAEVERLTALGRRPGLAAVVVGDDPASDIYVAGKQKDAEGIGMVSRRIALPADAGEAAVLEAVAGLNADPAISGIIVQLPLPAGVDPARVQRSIDPAKDVDGLHPENAGLLLQGTPRFAPCTPAGIVELLHRQDVPVEGRHVVIVGRGLLVGRPLAVMLSLKAPSANATVTLCHTGTPDIARFTREADVVVVAAGRPGFFTADMVRPGAAVVDVGIHRVDGRLVGDCAPGVADVAGALTPVPGGVGPMTRAMLLVNTVAAAAAG